MNDYARELDPNLNATQYMEQYVERLHGHVDARFAGDAGTHDHMIAAKATLEAYASELMKVLKAPKDEHEAYLNDVIDKMDRVLDNPPEVYDPEMRVSQVVALVANRIRQDLRAISDFLITTRLEEGLR